MGSCRICREGEEVEPFVTPQPCQCTGSVGHIHESCLQQWIASLDGNSKRCEICLGTWDERYIMHTCNNKRSWMNCWTTRPPLEIVPAYALFIAAATVIMSVI